MRCINCKHWRLSLRKFNMYLQENLGQNTVANLGVQMKLHISAVAGHYSLYLVQETFVPCLFSDRLNNQKQHSSTYTKIYTVFILKKTEATTWNWKLIFSE